MHHFNIRPTTNASRILELAMRRYPKMSPGKAFWAFLSDRRQAAGGALRVDSRGGGEVQCTKGRMWDRPLFVYTRRIERPVRWTMPPIGPLEWPLDHASETLQLTKEPAVNKIHAINIDAALFYTESGRKAVAAQLRQLRKAK